MNIEATNSNNEGEKHENVKERLNNLLHKKILDQHERLNDLTNKLSGENLEDKVIRNADVQFQQGESSSEPIVEITENYNEDDATNHSEEDLNQYLLHHILTEKKKALLQNVDVMNFLQSKLKYNP